MIQKGEDFATKPNLQICAVLQQAARFEKKKWKSIEATIYRSTTNKRII
jgi:hypothetical protein